MENHKLYGFLYKLAFGPPGKSWTPWKMLDPSETFENYSFVFNNHWIPSVIVSEYDQEIPQSQTADNPMAPGKNCKIT